MSPKKPRTAIAYNEDNRPAEKEKEGLNVELYEALMKAYTPTEEDIKYKHSYDELVQLCKRMPCYVDMWRWNPVYDFQITLKDRLKNKTHAQRLLLLAKAVNRHKEIVLYEDSEIKETNEKSWRYQKKDNILSLRLWEYEEKHKGIETDAAITEERDREHCSIASDSDDSIKTVIQSAGTAPPDADSELLRNLLAVNTESMTINTQSQGTLTECSLNMANAADYTEFNSFIRVTSTQSQPSQPETQSQ